MRFFLPPLLLDSMLCDLKENRWKQIDELKAELSSRHHSTFKAKLRECCEMDAANILALETWLRDCDVFFEAL